MMNASFLPVDVIDCDHEFVSYPDFDALKLQVPGTPSIITEPDELVVVSKLFPEPS
jgi:hypothetical protein